MSTANFVENRAVTDAQAAAYRAFRALHELPAPFVLANAWAAASAIVPREAGFQALATSSAAIAHGLARADVAHAVSRDEAVAPKPVNVLIGPWRQFVPMEELAAAGVRRVSLGSALFSSAMGRLGRVAARVAEGDLAAAAEGMSALRFNAIFGGKGERGALAPGDQPHGQRRDISQRVPVGREDRLETQRGAAGANHLDQHGRNRGCGARIGRALGGRALLIHREHDFDVGPVRAAR